MRARPDIDEGRLSATLWSHYGVETGMIRFLAEGNDPDSSTFDVRSSDGRHLFMKLRSDGPAEAVSRVLRWLVDEGATEVVAPLAGSNGEPFACVDGYAIALYPFIDGAPAMTVGLTDAQWEELGGFLHRLHGTDLPVHLRSTLPTETFRPAWGPAVRRIAELIATGAPAVGRDPVSRSFAGFWKNRSAEIERLVARTEELGRAAGAAASATALCHADIHTANVIVDGQGALHIVDWDGMLFAPPERDLMFVPEEHRGLFSRGYGPGTPDPLLIAYYRYEWAVQEIGDYGTRVLLPGGAPDTARREAVRDFRFLFEPDNEVDWAYEADAAMGLNLAEALTDTLSNDEPPPACALGPNCSPGTRG